MYSQMVYLIESYQISCQEILATMKVFSFQHVTVFLLGEQRSLYLVMTSDTSV